MKDKQSAIPKATAKDSLLLPNFQEISCRKIERANSKQIAEAIGIDSATVRRDFSYFGELGRRGFGYDVKKLMNFLLISLMITHYQCYAGWDWKYGPCPSPLPLPRA